MRRTQIIYKCISEINRHPRKKRDIAEKYNVSLKLIDMIRNCKTK
jgi:hypothetical protein